MNESEDRPTTSDRPAPYGDPPETPRASEPQGGPPAEPAPPEATWEDVVDPVPDAPLDPSTIPLPATVPPPAPPAQPAPPPAPPAAAPPVAAPGASAIRRGTTAVEEEADPGVDDYDEDYVEGPATRWVSLMATVGTALIGIVTVQVLASLVEGLTLKSGQRVGVPDDLFHRLGYPFGGLGATALIFLVLGVVLMSMPNVLDELLSEAQDRVVGITLLVSMVMSVIIAVGSLLAVRANLHEYAAKNVAVPSYVRVQFTNFLLGSLGAAALSLFGAIAAMNERSREAL